MTIEELLQSILDAITGFFSGAFANLYTQIFDLFHNIVDFFISIVYFGKYIFSIFASLFTPIQFFFYFLKEVLTGFTDNITFSTPVDFSDSVLEILHTIPNFDILSGIVGSVLIILMIFGAIRYIAE